MDRPLRGQARSHRDFMCAVNLRMSKIQCGSELARDGGVSANEDIGCAGPFASRLAPKGEARFTKKQVGSKAASWRALISAPR
jgi:hypothetical protein